MVENSTDKAHKIYSISKFKEFVNFQFHLFSCNFIYSRVLWAKVTLQKYPRNLKPTFKGSNHTGPTFSNLFRCPTPSQGLHIKDTHFSNLGLVGINKAYICIGNASSGNQNYSGIFWMEKITWHIHCTRLYIS